MTKPYDWGQDPGGTNGHVVTYRPYDGAGWPQCSWCRWIVPGTLDLSL